MVIWSVIFLIIGVILLIKGADFFVDGASNIAKLFGIPSLVIGLTLVSMGTSAPEASVSIQASLTGANDISLGNVLGSNIANSTLILGLSALIAPIVISKEVKIYDIPIMIGTSLLCLLFSYVITPGILEIWESIILLVLLVGYIVFLVLRSRKEIKQEKENMKNKGEDTAEEIAEKRISFKFVLESIVFAILVIACILFFNVISPNKFELYESIITLVIFAGYIALLLVRMILNKKKEKDEPKEEAVTKPVSAKRVKVEFITKSLILVALGLCGVIFGGTLVVENAKEIASQFGMSETLVGLTIVAVGTSLPELVTSMVAASKKENDIAIGNVVGSNIFNILFVLGLSAAISPIAVNPSTLFDGIAVLAIAVIMFFLCFFFKKLNRWQGGILTAIYIGYITYIIIRDITATAAL